MHIDVSDESLTALAEYARIQTAFEVRSVLDVTAQENGLGGLLLTERSLDVPYTKDYDAMQGDAPTEWAERFDLSRWGVLLARVDGQSVGGAAVAFDTPGLHQLEDRRDVAVLWDIRVAPAMRGRGVGALLFRAAEAWAATRRCEMLVVETQNTNVAACRFYVRHGCYLGAIRRNAYVELPDEVQLLWYKQLSTEAERAGPSPVARNDKLE